MYITLFLVFSLPLLLHLPFLSHFHSLSLSYSVEGTDRLSWCADNLSSSSPYQSRTSPGITIDLTERTEFTRVALGAETTGSEKKGKRKSQDTLLLKRERKKKQRHQLCKGSRQSSQAAMDARWHCSSSQVVSLSHGHSPSSHLRMQRLYFFMFMQWEEACTFCLHCARRKMRREGMRKSCSALKRNSRWCRFFIPNASALVSLLKPTVAFCTLVFTSILYPALTPSLVHPPILPFYTAFLFPFFSRQLFRDLYYIL